MNYATLKTHDVANGIGIRVSLFVSGCTHKCKGCFNSEAWDFDYGTPYGDDVEQKIIQALAPDYIRGLSLLGGEPFEPQNQPTLLHLLELVRSLYPQKTVWCYSGYTFEDDILSGRLGDTAIKMLNCIDVLVDGEFVEAKKDLGLRFRGSSNQRIIDVRRSLAENKTVILTDF
ncbi:MAG: anaerobic ribonucleoside-triphosphate reductase activating protein [Clostridia bacterium]|nr:anaerobic ribonucleoside-triphosphate reductase activating protein [Clostridia bacterium]